jgi:hypothetical protein
MLHYEENKCVCTNIARKINDQKRLQQKNFARTIARKMSTGRGQQNKTEYTENKILYFFRIILLLFHISFYFFLVYYSIIFLNIFNFP